jgi:hypothetical protein
VAELNELKDKEAGQGAPQLTSKWEPEAPLNEDDGDLPTHEELIPLKAPQQAEGLLTGHTRVSEGVPWSVA